MKNILLMIITALSANATAAEWVTPNITSVKAFDSQDNQFIHVSNFSNPGGCSDASTVVILRADNTDWKVLHSTLLAGFLAGKTIKLRVNGCSSNNSSAVVDGVEIMR
jgi:hypothetical protein